MGVLGCVHLPNLAGLELHRGTGENGRRENIIVLAAVQHALRDGREVSKAALLVFLYPTLSLVLSSSKTYDVARSVWAA